MNTKVNVDDIPVEDERTPSDNEIGSVVELAREQYRLEQMIESLTAQLKEAQEAYRKLTEAELPGLMIEVGTRGLTLKDGTQLRLEEQIFASLNKDRQPEAYDWLDDHNHGDLIKREFNIRFDREDEKWASKFAGDLKKRKRPLNTSIKRSIHPGTLNKWVRETLEAGEVIPEDLFGVFRKRVSKLIPPKKSQATEV